MNPVTICRAVAADAETTFGLVTDIDRLPEWDTAITRVIERPLELAPGSQWVGEVTALGQRWPSRSTLETLDAAGRRLRYRSGTADGNPSYAVWS